MRLEKDFGKSGQHLHWAKSLTIAAGVTLNVAPIVSAPFMKGGPVCYAEGDKKRITERLPLQHLQVTRLHSVRKVFHPLDTCLPSVIKDLLLGTHLWRLIVSGLIKLQHPV